MDEVLIVAGFGRCGSSLLMQMLHAGGVPCVGDPPGFEPPESSVHSLTPEWLIEQRGRAVKILDPHLTDRNWIPDIPRRVIWLDRDNKQQAKSFLKFGRDVGGLPFVASDWMRIAAGLRRDRPLALMKLGISKCPTLHMKFEHLLDYPDISCKRLAEWLPPHLKFDRYRARRQIVKRTPKCLPHLMELDQLKARGHG